MNRKLLFLFLSLALTAPALSEPMMRPQSTHTSTQEPTDIALVIPSHLNLIVSLVWEGRAISDTDVSKIRSIRDQFPGITISHFISPAYFTSDQDSAFLARDRIMSTIRPGDHVGIHLAPWQLVVEKAEVTYRPYPTFWAQDLGGQICQNHCGADVPLSAYQPDEIEKIVAVSRDLLRSNGFGSPVSAMVAGWSSTHDVAESLARNDIRYDFSAVNLATLKSRLEHFPLYEWIKPIWSHINSDSQPYLVSTKSNVLTVYPQHSGPVDYQTPEQLLENFKTQIRNIRTNLKPLTWHFVMYQETASSTWSRTTDVFRQMTEYAQSNGVTIKTAEFPRTDFELEPSNRWTTPSPPERFVH